MKDFDAYCGMMRVFLGDTGERRYTAAALELALSEALAQLDMYAPRIETVKVEPDHGFVRPFSSVGEVVCLRRENGVPVPFSDEGGFLRIYPRLPAGTKLTAELRLPHTIRGMENAAVTTVPDALTRTIVSGASAFAMRIRVRTVTEVFGKRPEDAENLLSQAEELLKEFVSEMDEFSRRVNGNPWE